MDWLYSQIHTDIPKPLLVTGYVSEWSHTQRPMHCDHYCSIMSPHVRFKYSSFIHHSSLLATDTPSSESGCWQEMPDNLDGEVFLSYFVGIFNMP
jgi:hypothetical protein